MTYELLSNFVMHERYVCFNIIKKSYVVEYQNAIINYNEIAKYEIKEAILNKFIILITANQQEYKFKINNCAFVSANYQNLTPYERDNLFDNKILLDALAYNFTNNNVIIQSLKSKNSNLIVDKIYLNNKILLLSNKLNKKDMLNKRLIDTLMLYRYKEFNDTTTYDYDEIKQKNKALNTEFKRVAKLMKLC